MQRIIFTLVGLYCLAFINFLSAQEHYNIKGKIIDVETKKNISDVVITILQNQKSILSNEDGSFELQVESEDNITQRLHYYRIGYYDTIVECKPSGKQLIVKLRPKVYELGEVIISAKRNREKYQIGSYDISVGGDYFLYKNASMGVYVKAKKDYKNSTLTSISFHVADAGKLGRDFSLRIVSPRQRMTPKKAESVNEMRDVLKQPILCPVSKRGWNKIDLREYNIQLPNASYFVIFTSILKNNQKIEDRVLLSMYERAYKKTPFYAAYYVHDENKLLYNHFRKIKTDYMPAVVLHCEK